MLGSRIVTYSPPIQSEVHAPDASYYSNRRNAEEPKGKGDDEESADDPKDPHNVTIWKGANVECVLGKHTRSLSSQRYETRARVSRRTDRHVHPRSRGRSRQRACHESLSVQTVHHQRHRPGEALKHDCPYPHFKSCLFRLGWNHCASHRTNNQQGVYWEDPGGHSVCDFQSLLLE